MAPPSLKPLAHDSHARFTGGLLSAGLTVTHRGRVTRACDLRHGGLSPSKANIQMYLPGDSP